MCCGHDHAKSRKSNLNKQVSDYKCVFLCVIGVVIIIAAENNGHLQKKFTILSSNTGITHGQKQ